MRFETQNQTGSAIAYSFIQLQRWTLMPLFMLIICLIFGCAPICADNAEPAQIAWKFSAHHNMDFAKPSFDDSSWQTVGTGHKWKCADFAWFRSRIQIPSAIDDIPTAGQAIAIEWNAADGGECYVDGKIYVRYDNDHPALILLTKKCTPGHMVDVAIRVFMGADSAEHERTLDHCKLVIVDKKTIAQPFDVKVDSNKTLGALPSPYIGLSQGGGLPDYSDDLAKLFREYGIKWFRMDNLLTNAVKKNDDGTLRYDWTDLDRRLDFMRKVGCELIFCISYMPEPYDAVEDHNRHSYPRDWDEFGELVYQAAKHCIDRGTPVKYWEVWNEINTGWMRDPEGWDHLKTYTTLYDTCWKAVRRADPKAWIGGPAVASGPWNENDPRGPGVNGEKFMRGLFEHCEKTGAALDFVTWHEYFHPPSTMKKEAEQIREYLDDYPKVKKQVKEYAVTEWGYAWWHDRAGDNEIGGAWAAATLLKGWMAAGVHKPCWFYAKDGCSPPCGDWGMFTSANKPKPVAHVCRLFNIIMAPEKLSCDGEDDQIGSVASIDPKSGRITVLIFNFAERFGSPRQIKLTISGRSKPASCRRYLVDASHSNVINDESKPDLETVPCDFKQHGDSIVTTFDLENNAVTLIEL